MNRKEYRVQHTLKQIDKTALGKILINMQITDAKLIHHYNFTLQDMKRKITGVNIIKGLIEMNVS